jgi:hypothetical protein
VGPLHGITTQKTSTRIIQTDRKKNLSYIYISKYIKIATGTGIFLFATACRLTVGPTQRFVQWVSGFKRPRRESDQLAPSDSVVRL